MTQVPKNPKVSSKDKAVARLLAKHAPPTANRKWSDGRKPVNKLSDEEKVVRKGTISALRVATVGVAFIVTKGFVYSSKGTKESYHSDNVLTYPNTHVLAYKGDIVIFFGTEYISDNTWSSRPGDNKRVQVWLFMAAGGIIRTKQPDMMLGFATSPNRFENTVNESSQF